MAGKGGGAWKVAYADFVTAMMAFFLVMWITSQNEEVKVAIAGYFEDPWGTSSEHSAPSMLQPSELPGGVPTAVQRRPPKTRPLQPAQSNGPEDGANTSRWVQQDKVHFRASTDRTLPALLVRFDEASATFSEQAERQLGSFVSSVVGKLNKIEIRAHSTQRPLPADSPFADHWQLCYARSRAVMQFLADRGVEPERIRLSQSAAYEPLTQRFEANFQADNNCVEVFLLNEVMESAKGTTKPPRKSRSPQQQAATTTAANDH